MGKGPPEQQSHYPGSGGDQATLSVPDHKEVAVGTLRSLIRSAGLTVEAFTEAAG